jgi:hypothetical protein
MARCGEVVASPHRLLRGISAVGYPRTHRSEVVISTPGASDNPSARTEPCSAPRCNLSATREDSMEGDLESWRRRPDRDPRMQVPIGAATNRT